MTNDPSELNRRIAMHRQRITTLSARRQAQRAADKDLDTVIEVYTERIRKLEQQLERYEEERTTIEPAA